MRAIPSDGDVTKRPGTEPRGTAPLAAAGAAASGAGAAAVATAATVCCAGPVIAPLVVGILGAGGAAWAAGLKAYAPWLLGASFLLLAYGFRAGYRRPAACGPAAPAGRRPWARATSRVVLWLAAILWLVAALANLAIAIER